MKKIKDIQTRWQNHLMIIAAFRYCLGRQSYIVLECVEWLSEWWNDIHEATKACIIEEIEDALENDNAGDVCDRELWRSFLDYIKNQTASSKGTMV